MSFWLASEVFRVVVAPLLTGNNPGKLDNGAQLLLNPANWALRGLRFPAARAALHAPTKLLGSVEVGDVIGTECCTEFPTL